MTRMMPLAPLLLALWVGLMGCDEIEDLDNFDVNIKQETSIPAASALELILGDFPVLDSFTEFDLAQSATFKNSGHDPDDVDSVTLESLVFKTLAPPEQDLAFFGEVIFFIEAEGLPRKELARQDTFPEGQTRVSFNVVGDNIKDYVMANEASITVEVIDTSRPEQETTIEIEAIFDVDVDVL